MESRFDKVATLKSCNFIKKRLQHRCFPVNIAKFLRTVFFIEHHWWLLLFSAYIPHLAHLSCFINVNFSHISANSILNQLICNKFILIVHKLDCISLRYEEVCHTHYDFETQEPGDAGHFTQIVWKDTKTIGFGKAISKNKAGLICTYVVARYKPAGNIVEQFRENVKKGSFDESMCSDLKGTLLSMPSSTDVCEDEKENTDMKNFSGKDGNSAHGSSDGNKGDAGDGKSRKGDSSDMGGKVLQNDSSGNHDASSGRGSQKDQNSIGDSSAGTDKDRSMNGESKAGGKDNEPLISPNEERKVGNEPGSSSTGNNDSNEGNKLSSNGSGNGDSTGDASTGNNKHNSKNGKNKAGGKANEPSSSSLSSASSASSASSSGGSSSSIGSSVGTSGNMGNRNSPSNSPESDQNGESNSGKGGNSQNNNDGPNGAGTNGNQNGGNKLNGGMLFASRL